MPVPLCLHLVLKVRLKCHLDQALTDHFPVCSPAPRHSLLAPFPSTGYISKHLLYSLTLLGAHSSGAGAARLEAAAGTRGDPSPALGRQLGRDSPSSILPSLLDHPVHVPRATARLPGLGTQSRAGTGGVSRRVCWAKEETVEVWLTLDEAGEKGLVWISLGEPKTPSQRLAPSHPPSPQPWDPSSQMTPSWFYKREPDQP